MDNQHTKKQYREDKSILSKDVHCGKSGADSNAKICSQDLFKLEMIAWEKLGSKEIKKEEIHGQYWVVLTQEFKGTI